MKRLIAIMIMVFPLSLLMELSAQNMQYENTVVPQPTFRVIDVTKDTERTNGVIYFNNNNRTSTYEYSKRRYPRTKSPVRQVNITKSGNNVITNDTEDSKITIYNDLTKTNYFKSNDK